MIKPEQKNLYPLLFKPIYKSVIWGGSMLSSYLHRKRLSKHELPIGEAWEIADRGEDVSMVENGPLAGKNLRVLIEAYGSDLVGQKNINKRFPLLIKIIDAGQRLSLQVHPDEAVCRKIIGAEPKTEMWYVITSKKNAKVFVGLNNKATKRNFMDSYNSPDIEKYLHIYKSVPGDAYFITSGTVHAIGEGNLLLEIQQNSDTTYRINDWGRVGINGNSRELHIKDAMESIHFTKRVYSKITGVSGSTMHNRKYPIINKCPFFKVDDLKLINRWDDKTTGKFHILTAINNNIRVGKGKKSVEVKTGRSCLVPAAFGDYSIFVDETKETTVIKTQN